MQAVGQRLGGRWVFRKTSLSLPAGGLTLLIGPNGCGKTTLLKQAATVLTPSQGRVIIAGQDAQKNRQAVRRHTAYMGAWPALYEDLSVQENLGLFLQARRGRGALQEIPAAAAALGLENRLHARIRTLSSGLRKRTALCLMALSRASLWLLDEPETTLDPSGTAWLLGALKAHLSGGGGALVATHQPDVFAALAPMVLSVGPAGVKPVNT